MPIYLQFKAASNDFFSLAALPARSVVIRPIPVRLYASKRLALSRNPGQMPAKPLSYLDTRDELIVYIEVHGTGVETWFQRLINQCYNYRAI